MSTVLHGDFISDGGVLWRAEDMRLYGNIADTPNYYERESLFKNTNDHTKIETPSKLLVNINNHGYIAEQSYTLNLNSTAYYDSDSVSMATPYNRGGRNIYIYAVERNNSEVPGFILSANSTVPTSYNPLTSRKIGGFHCICDNVGNIPGHPYSGYRRGDIIPISIWDLKHLPTCSPEGMVWVKEINKWVDIYFDSWNGNELVSEYNGVIADGNSNNNQSWNGEKFVEYLAKIGKTLPSRNEFMVFAKESNERTNITGSVDPVFTGGHIDTNSLRMISNYALEDCCGVMYQWTSDITEYTPNATWNRENQYLNGYEWSFNPVYKEGIDNINYGGSYGVIRRFVVGGAWDTGIYSGSRSVRADLLSAYCYSKVGARGVCAPKYI